MIDVQEQPQSAAPARGFSPGGVVLIVGVVVFAAVIGIALVRQNRTQPTAGAAPDFSVTTFDGQPLSLDDLRGQVVVLNFWASWCIPCIDEAPILQRLYERYRERGVTFVGIAYLDDEALSRAFLAEYGVTYPNAPDVGTRVSDDYHIQGVPETFIIDQNGTIVEFIYAAVDEAALAATLERLTG